MENNNQKVHIFVTIATILILVIIFAGVTYAYFTANNPTGSTAEIKSETGRMLITYNDGTDNIVPITNIQPSNKILVNKTFTLTGSNTTVGMKTGDGLSMPYKVGLGYNSTFSDGMIHYYIKEVERPTNSNVTANYVITPEPGKTEDDYKNQTVPGNDTYTGYVHGTLKNGTDVYTEMVNGEFPADLNDQTIKFNLIIQFPDNNENQDSEKGKTINGKIIINKEFKTMTQSITELYANNDKDADGITLDGLQKDGTGAYNIQNVSTTNEKYNVKFLGNIPNNIIADTETDAYDNLRYVGANPNNYLSFNGETWRIIGIFNNITSIDEKGKEKKESLVKIVRNDSLGEYSWDSSASDINSGNGINEWSQADLMHELNTDYLNTSGGIAFWYSGQNNETKHYNFYNNIKSDSIDKIATVRWNLGGYSTDRVSALNMYNAERGTLHISNPSDGITRKDYWDGKIALIYPSDYGYASTGTACRNSLYDGDDAESKANNWLDKDMYYWILTSYTEVYSYRVFYVHKVGGIYQGTYGDHTCVSRNVFPSLFLKSDVVIVEGTGTESDPFILK